MGKLINSGFTNSKVSSHKVISDSSGKILGKFGSNTNKTGVSFKSGTKGAMINGC